MTLRLISGPDAEAIDIAEARAQVKQDSTDRDAELARHIATARQTAEQELLRTLMPCIWELVLDCFPCWEIRLPRPPIVSVASITYVDGNGVTQTLDGSAWQLDADSEPGRLMPAYGYTWPSTRAQPGAVRVRYSAGYADADAVPSAIKSWMLLAIGDLFEKAESVNVGNIVSPYPFVGGLLDRYRVFD